MSVDVRLPIRRKRGKRPAEILRSDVRLYGSKTADSCLVRVRYPKYDSMEILSLSQLAKEYENVPLDTEIIGCEVCRFEDGSKGIIFPSNIILSDGDGWEVKLGGGEAYIEIKREKK